AGPSAAPATPPASGADDATQAIPVVPAAAPPVRRPDPAVPLRPAPATALPPLRRTADDDGEERSPARTTLAVVAGGLGVILVAILLVTQVFGGGNDQSAADRAKATSSQAATTPKTTSSSSTPAVPQLVRGDYKVFVLNSTNRNGAARDAANKLESSGFQIAGTGQAVTQTMPTTQIAFKDGSKRAALEVAKLLGVSSANVIAADPSTLVAGGQANVVVTLGADKVQ
ncbi:MAG: LytR cell envelope-related transcriptional attenuator, partial [Solirubrobacterales bacterium]|nr:LytR cell envelope-related transcriptional attenuator [Solirubrobacterales bacterium]